LASENAAAASAVLAGADATQTALDRIATAADLVLTNADVVLTHADVVLTNDNVVLTNADVVTTGNAVTAAELVYDNFDDRYLGAKAVAPTLDNDGDALITGAMYFDTVLEYMLVYTGTLWIPAGSSVNGTSQRESFTATASQTTFTVTGGYDPNFIDVYLNGAKLVNGVDVTVTSGTDVVLAVGATVGDAVDIVAYGTFAIADTYTKAEIDLKAPLASPTFTGTVTTGLVTATENISFATGKGIDFSAATGSAAGSTSAVLDDYEEGTWTPTDAGVKLSVSGTWEVGTATYTKIGDTVHLRADFSGTGIGFSALGGYFSWSGLPFTPAAESIGGSYCTKNVTTPVFGGSIVTNSGNRLFLHSPTTTGTTNAIVAVCSYKV
jgi:hypothetical protein